MILDRLLKTLAGATLLGFGASGGALAADILPVDYPPVYEDVPEIEAVEISNGWYLRGDVAYDFATDFDGRHRDYRPDYARFGYAAGPYGQAQYGTFDGDPRHWEMDGNAAFGAGVGYQFTDYFRGDVTANYWKTDVATADGDLAVCRGAYASAFGLAGGASCAANTTASAKAWEVMANAYVDLGTVAGFTPYGGAGVGAVQVNYEDLKSVVTCSYAGTPCNYGFASGTVAHEDISDWRFAYSLMAGLAYDVSPALKLDVGYRFLSVDGGDMGSFGEADRALGATGAEFTDEGFDRHTIQAGLRYSLF